MYTGETKLIGNCGAPETLCALSEFRYLLYFLKILSKCIPNMSALFDTDGAVSLTSSNTEGYSESGIPSEPLSKALP